MDAHYDQVMNAREKAANSQGIRRYFGYSTVLDRAAFEEWRSQHGYDFFSLPEGQLAEGVDLELVYDFPSRWWGGRVAGLRNATGKSIFGRLYEIAEMDWPIVQHKEGAVTGMSVEREVRVRAGGQEWTATAFTTNPVRASLDGPVSQRFVEALMRGAKAAALPAHYLELLAASAK